MMPNDMVEFECYCSKCDWVYLKCFCPNNKCPLCNGEVELPIKENVKI